MTHARRRLLHAVALRKSQKTYRRYRKPPDDAIWQLLTLKEQRSIRFWGELEHRTGVATLLNAEGKLVRLAASKLANFLTALIADLETVRARLERVTSE
jgi:hypothetical protein